MKKIVLALFLLMGVAVSKAQFEQGTKYVGASVSEFGLSYSSCEKFRFGIDATAGYFLYDGVMLKANVGYSHKPHFDDITLGVGGRYYFTQNGIFLGTGLEYCHETKSYNDLRIPVEAGYCFYINNHVSIEPAVYYKMSLNDFSDKSAVGLKIGFGLYF
ncbi:MAG: hypothetical protein ACI4TR_02755 [Bacteroidaceae bacterium]